MSACASLEPHEPHLQCPGLTVEEIEQAKETASGRALGRLFERKQGPS